MDYAAIIKTPLPTVKLGIYVVGQYLCRIDFFSEDVSLIHSTEPFVQLIVSELNSYFKNPSIPFSIPYRLSGTPFQKRVWETLTCLPHQKTTTYNDLAKKLKTSPRAIGNACRANPLPLLIPCHRVVAQNSLGGYKGKNIAIKKWLLAHEAKDTAVSKTSPS